MILLVSGEGPSDIGSCSNGHGQCSGADFRAGPMAVIIDKIAESVTMYSLLAIGAVEFVSEHALCSHSKQKIKNTFAFVGKKRDYETAFFFKNARALARLAKDRTMAEGAPVGAILFRDADGTRSTERGLFEQKWKSIVDGFSAEQFDYGVPMVPKPKSEAWLLCALKPNPYQSCAGLETSLSGSDHAPNPAKEQLEARLQALGKTIDDLSDMVTDGTISPSRIDMPSFNQFKARLESVTYAMCGRRQPTTGA